MQQVAFWPFTENLMLHYSHDIIDNVAVKIVFDITEYRGHTRVLFYRASPCLVDFPSIACSDSMFFVLVRMRDLGTTASVTRELAESHVTCSVSVVKQCVA